MKKILISNGAQETAASALLEGKKLAAVVTRVRPLVNVDKKCASNVELFLIEVSVVIKLEIRSFKIIFRAMTL